MSETQRCGIESELTTCLRTVSSAALAVQRHRPADFIESLNRSKAISTTANVNRHPCRMPGASGGDCV